MLFKDRQGTNLNRKKIKIISQTANEIIADIERYDTVSDEGTPINAETFNQFQTEINTANTNANNAVQVSNTASSTASTAKINSETAINTANEANSKSDSALSTSNTALTNSSSAVSTANNASENASSAVTTANNALTNANNAVDTATTASENASSALSKSTTALTNSENAVTTANSANTKSQTALTKSEQAIADSAYAKNKADEVETKLADRGATVKVNGAPVTDIEFASDPQTQINTKLSKTFSGFTAKTSLADTDIFAVQETTNNTNAKVTLSQIKSTILNSAYPVGAIYMSVNSTNPGTLFGGTWEQLKDRFLLGGGGSYTAGTTGGETNHTLTTAELPSHNHANTISVSATQPAHEHTINSGSGKCTNAAGLGYGYCYAIGGPDNDTSGRSARSTTGTGTDLMNTTTPSISVSHSITNAYTGSGQAHNNMPPYLVVYMWKRTA